MPNEIAQAHRLAEKLDARLLAAASATAVLQAWCEEFGIGEGAVIARCSSRIPSADDEMFADEWLGVGAEPRSYRKVRLMRGGVVLSDAENWFLPQRLTADMRAALAETETPFGTVVKALKPTRETILSRICFSPDEKALPDVILEHRALLRDGAGAPLAVVREHYRATLLRTR
ncbi:hypothetical protein [Microvirga flavescens]|uniref:hypothetical protein n=1 Tax=Microvirga flavescens TaxID=2249811 RepID=UPI0013009343|nr:hypothetical protein [Microvirga flavescens]